MEVSMIKKVSILLTSISTKSVQKQKEWKDIQVLNPSMIKRLYMKLVISSSQQL